MKITYNWLKEYIDFNLTYSELAEKFTDIGMNVESMQLLGAEIEGVISGKILSIKQHSQADRLKVCIVDIGDTEKTIVCGATNMKVGDKVPVALENAVLCNGLKIKKAVLRGVASEGMMCSAKELGIADDAMGLLILPTEMPIGKNIKDLLCLPDAVFDLEITPNRPDCLSVIGIARELAASLDKPFKFPNTELKETAGEINKLAKVTIEDSDLCSRYIGRLILDVKISESPFWLKRRLEMVGLRPINNVVDATNYVLMELGHPLHAFDYDMLDNHHIIVRRALNGEKFKTLDNNERELTGDMLVIADEKKPVALAGIMGGYNSQVKEETRNLLIESAYFEPINIRRTSKKLNLVTDSSYRFERGADYEMTIKAINRVTALIQEIAGGKIAKGMINQSPKEISSDIINLRPERVNKILGVVISKTEISGLLGRLGFECDIQDLVLKVKVPTFRREVTREIDLIEEIARVYGYEKIPVCVPKWEILEHKQNEEFLVEENIKRFLVGIGFFEVINYSFNSENAFVKWGLENNYYFNKAVKIKNPLSLEYEFLRTTLLMNIFENIAKNISYNVNNLKFFEIGRIFLKKENGSLPEERKMVSGAICGMDEKISWQKKSFEIDFYYLKGIIEKLFGNLGLKNYIIEQGENIILHPIQSAKIIASTGQEIGFIGKISPKIASKYGFDFPVYLFELDLGSLVNNKEFKKYYHPISRYPSAARDIALLVPEGILHMQIYSKIKEIGGADIFKIKLFDIYKGEQVDEKYKSLAYSLVYQSKEKTLTDKEITVVHNKIINNLEKSFGIKIRGN